MHRFHVPKLATLLAPPAAGTPAIDLEPEESHHAARVLRLAVGEAVSLFDGAGIVAHGVIDRLKPRVRVLIAGSDRRERPRPVIEVAAAIPKGPRADAMIEQLSQLGCDRLIPLRTTRSVVDPRDAKIERFARAAIESAKQCGRDYLMQIDGPVDLVTLLARVDHDLRVIAAPQGMKTDAMEEGLAGAARVLVLIGPEGGFTTTETEQARAAGFAAWSLGPNILRIETAAAAAVALLRR